MNLRRVSMRALLPAGEVCAAVRGHLELHWPRKMNVVMETVFDRCRCRLGWLWGGSVAAKWNHLL